MKIEDKLKSTEKELESFREHYKKMVNSTTKDSEIYKAIISLYEKMIELNKYYENKK